MRILISILLTSLGLAFLGCGSNTNPLLSPGNHCAYDFEDFSLDLSEEELKEKVGKQEKFSQKPGFNEFPNGEYKMIAVDFYYVELTNGEEKNSENFKMALRDRVASPLLSEKTLKNNDRVIEHNGEKHLFTPYCFRNANQDKLLANQFDVVTNFKIENRQTTDYEALKYSFYHAPGPEGRFTKTISDAVDTGDTMDDFLGGNNEKARSLDKTTYEVVTSESIQKKNKITKFYEMRTEFKSNDYLIRTRVTYQKL